MQVNNGRLTNHIAIVLDASSSMSHLTDAVVRTADELIAFLAKDSQEKDQETRVSVYTFSSVATCRIWDMDVLRLPSMKGYYQPDGMTALIDATIQALDDGDLITEKYGNHAHLVYVITDGYENRSKGVGSAPAYGRALASSVAERMIKRLDKMPDNRSVALLVPDDESAKSAAGYGLGGGTRGVSVALWDASSEAGLVQAVEKIKTATASYTASRATGLRSAGNNLFTLGANVDAKQIKANLKALKNTEYQLVPVVVTPDAYDHKVKGKVVEIKPFVDYACPPYRVGKAYYQLFTHGKRASEKIQGNKAIAIVEKKTNKVYVGDEARQLLGLPDYEVRVKPDSHPDFELYVQSSSVNRQLPIGTKVLLLTS